jgi:phospholipid/cholesterol/gamma-HCH transport system permease protein
MNEPVKSYNQFHVVDSKLSLPQKLEIDQVEQFYQQSKEFLKGYKKDKLHINFNEVEAIDSAGITVVELIKHHFEKKNVEVIYENLSETVEKKLSIFSLASTQAEEKADKEHYLVRVGDKAWSFWQDVVKFIVLTADIFYWTLHDLFSTKSRRKGEFYNQAVIIGVKAVPIVTTLAFIIGLVLALQSAAQLRSFGANIYIVDLTVIAMMREMGPLITAILVAGRSGSAIAAEIATMKVTSELDALTTMALNPIRFVVVPKMYGAIFTLPFLVVLANLMGIIGGMVVAYFYLDISPDIFINRMSESLFIRDILTGFAKSLFFAGIIVLTGCYYGFRVDKGAEGVGKVTTSAVVVAITLVIIADSIFGLLFY